MTSSIRTIVAGTSTIALVVLAVFGFTAKQASAASRTQLGVEPTGDFVIGPGKTEVRIAPGETETEQITITNRTGQTTEFAVEIEDFTAATTSDRIVQLLGQKSGPRSLRDFLSPELQEFRLEPGEQIRFQVDVAVPEGAEPGGRYGAVIVSNAPAVNGAGGTTARVISRLASLFLVRVEGEMDESGRLTEFAMSGPDSVFWHSDQVSSFQIGFENTGNVHLTPYGQITISNLLGQTVATLPVDAYFTLPESTRFREISWSPGFLLGYYKAELSLNRSYDNTLDTASAGFWVLPWKVIAFGLLIILLLVSIVRWFKNRFEVTRKGS